VELGLESEVTFGVLGSICEPGPTVRIVFSLNKREHLRVLVVEESTPCATAGAAFQGEGSAVVLGVEIDLGILRPGDVQMTQGRQQVVDVFDTVEASIQVQSVDAQSRWPVHELHPPRSLAV